MLGKEMFSFYFSIKSRLCSVPDVGSQQYGLLMVFSD